jgi:uncharacterized protein (TIGR02147 family)
MKTDIYNYTDPADFLNFELEMRKGKNPKYSLRAWSRQLGFENPAFLSQILLKKRKLKLELAQKLSAQMKLSAPEAKYFQSLVLLANAKGDEEKRLLTEVLEDLRPRKVAAHTPVHLDIFKFIADWQHVAILEMFHLKDFDGTAEKIIAWLHPEVAPSTTLKALERLERLELITRTKSGKLQRTKESKYLIDQNIPNEAARGFHRQMIQKGLDAIGSQAITERTVSASTVCLRARDYKKALEILREAHEKITALARHGDGVAVYQFNSQFFKLIKSPQGDDL